MRPLAARRVDVHAGDARRREAVGQQPLHLLRPQPALAHHRAAALRTGTGHLLGVLAIVTDEALGHAVIRETDRAVRTVRDVTARPALHERRIAAPIQEQNALFALPQTVAQ